MRNIHPKAKIGEGNEFGHDVRIGENVSIGNNNKIEDNVSMFGDVSIGSGNIIGIGTIIGRASNHVLRKQGHDKNGVGMIHIGDENIIGELVTVHSPVYSLTHIGNGTNIGTRTHVAHDAKIEDKSIVSVHCGLGGYVRILQGANVGIGVNIHPRIIIGQYSMVGVSSVVVRHILPCATVVGNPQRYLKPNTIGMTRNGLSKSCIEEMGIFLNNGGKSELKNLSRDASNILQYYIKILQSNEFIRDVPSIPINITNLELDS